MALYDQYLNGYNQANGYLGQQQKYASQMGLLGDQMRDPYSAQNQYNLRTMSAQFNSAQPNYFELAAAQGYGGPQGGLAGMQQTAAKRQAGLLTGSQYGMMMNDNQKTALGYYGQQAQGMQSAQAGQQGLLSLDTQNRNLEYQDKWKTQELEEQKRQYDDQRTGFWGDLLNVGLGVAGSFAGGVGGRFGKKWAG